MIACHITELGGNDSLTDGRTNGLGSSRDSDGIADSDIYRVVVGAVMFICNSNNVCSCGAYKNRLGMSIGIPNIRDAFRSSEFCAVAIANGIIAGDSNVR